MRKAFILIIATLLLLSGCGSYTVNIIEESESLTWWCPNRYSHVGNMGDSAVYIELMKQTGVDVEFIHPPKGEHRERLLALLGEDTLPDIISHDFIDDYPGGAEKALSDGVIVALNDVIEANCPNLTAYLQENPDIKKMISTKDGLIFCFPSIQADREIRTYMGPYIRADYLAQVGLDAPKTIDEWYAVMSAFKQELGVTPLSFYGGKITDTDFMIGGYGLSWGFFVDNGEVKLGPLEPEFEMFMHEFKRWVDEGLISGGIFTDSQTTYTAKAQRGDIGIYVDYVTSISKYSESIDGAEFIPITYPVLAKGEVALSGHIAPVFVPYASCYITPDNKNIEAAARLLDFAYSPQGSLLFNFGIEEESYTLVDGAPVYSQSMRDAPEGFSNAVKRYLASGAYVRDPRQFAQMLETDVQKQAVALWSNTEAEQHQMPTLVLSEAQAEAVAQFNEGYKDVVIGWLKDYCLSTAGAFSVVELQQTLLSMGAADVIDIYQEAIDDAA